MTKLKTYSLDDILLESKPDQFLLLEDLLKLFAQSHHLSHAFVRGSIAKSTFDRISDIDLVLAVDSATFAEIIASLDTLLAQNFNTLFPGWHDAIVPDFGGLGFVYLIEKNGILYQADIYVIPSEKADRLATLARSKLVYHNPTAREAAPNDLEAAEDFITSFLKTRRRAEHFFVEALILAFLIRKRIKRSQCFLNYSETHLLNVSIRSLLRSIYDPEHLAYGWYHIEENFARVEDGQRWSDYLEGLVHSTPVHSSESLKQAMRGFLGMCREVIPEVVVKYSESLNYYCKQCGIS